MTLTTKEKILEASIDLFSQKGFSAISVREITRTVGIKESSLYNHFKNKNEILETILQDFRVDFNTTLPPEEMLEEILEKSTPEEFLKKGLANFKNYMEIERNRKVWRILQSEQFREPLAREIILNEIFQKTIQFLTKVFAILIQTNKISDSKPELLAAEYQYPIFSMLAEYNILKFDDENTAAIEKRMDDHVHFFLTYLNKVNLI